MGRILKILVGGLENVAGIESHVIPKLIIQMRNHLLF
jgi:hypothetical protein